MKVVNEQEEYVLFSRLGRGEVFEYENMYYIKLQHDTATPYVALQLDLTILIHSHSDRGREWLSGLVKVKPYPHAYIKIDAE